MAKRNLTYQKKEFSISYEILNREERETIIFLHGWGSSKKIMKTIFSKNFKNYKHIYIDLIGFGESGDAQFPLNSFDYKYILEDFFQELNISKEIIVGHSFGGKIATLLNPQKLVLLSSAGIVIEKSFSVKMKISIYKIFKKIGLSSFRKLFISDDGKNLSRNMYETFKNVVDENFENIFRDRKDGETAVFWGKDDLATPLKSGEKIHQLIQNSNFYPLNGDHFFFVGKGGEIEKLLKSDKNSIFSKVENVGNSK